MAADISLPNSAALEKRKADYKQKADRWHELLDSSDQSEDMERTIDGLAWGVATYAERYIETLEEALAAVRAELSATQAALEEMAEITYKQAHSINADVITRLRADVDAANARALAAERERDALVALINRMGLSALINDEQIRQSKRVFVYGAAFNLDGVSGLYGWITKEDPSRANSYYIVVDGSRAGLWYKAEDFKRIAEPVTVVHKTHDVSVDGHWFPLTPADSDVITVTTVTDGSAEEVDAIVYSAWQRDYDSVLEIGVFTDLQKAFDALEVKPEEMVKVRPTLYVKDSPRSSWQSVGVTVETLNQIKRKPDYEWWYKDPAED